MTRWTLNLAAALLATGTLLADALPEAHAVYPIPHEIKLSGEAFAAPKKVALKTIGETDTDAIALLKTLFTVEEGAPFTLRLQNGAAFPAGTYKKLAEGGYALSIAPQEIIIHATDSAGFFYGAQTLAQIMRGGKLIPCTIQDWPDVAFRGTVEGFYGQPWSFEARKAQFRFYGKYKMNTYIYGPKDDPYHGFSNRWRDPYPAKEAEQIKELVTVAKANKVNFVWAVHPGRDIQWKNDNDIEACIKKFEMMYDLGVRAFAVFFDDIGGEGARADMQVKLLNRLNRDFVRVKKDVAPLLLCPTQYNKSWADKRPGTYLDILGEQLDSDINIMWTGNSVVHDITLESLQWINARIKRKAFIWWNWPVSDFVRARLLIGRAYGIDPANASELSGFVSNPMDKPEASMIGLFGIADYTWNMKDYNSEKSWREGIKRLFPECPQAVQTFADHNSDHGPNGHGYRRDESEAFRDPTQRILKALREKNKPLAADMRFVNDEFTRIEKASQTLQTKLNDPIFKEEAINWIRLFGETGRAGQRVCDIIETIDPMGAFKPAALPFFNDLIATYTARDAISAEQKTRPFQTEIKTAGKVMTPFIDDAAKILFARLYTQLSGHAPRPAAIGTYRAIGTVPQLQNATAERKGIYVNFGRVLEIVKVEPGQWFGLLLPEGVVANYIHAKLDTPQAATHGRIELSTDGGQNWKPQQTRNHGQEMESRLDPAHRFNAARYINTSSETVEIKINQFKLDVPEGARINTLEAAYDGDLFSGFTPAGLDPVTLPNREGKSTARAWLVSNGSCTVSAIDADGRRAAVRNDNGIISLEGLSQPVKALIITPTQPGLRLFEIIW